MVLGKENFYPPLFVEIYFLWTWKYSLTLPPKPGQLAFPYETSSENSDQPGWSRKNSKCSTYQKLQSPNTATSVCTEVESTINWCKLNRGSNCTSRLSLLRTWWIFWRLYKISNWPIAFSGNWECYIIGFLTQPGLSSSSLSSLTSSAENGI